MSYWWKPSDRREVDDVHRLELLVALKEVEAAAKLASDGSAEWATEGKATWAMRQLQALRGAEELLRDARVQLCRDARDAGLTLREIAEVAGTTHPTVSKWTAGERTTPTRNANADTPPWTLTAEGVREVASQAGVEPVAADVIIERGVAGYGPDPEHAH